MSQDKYASLTKDQLVLILEREGEILSDNFQTLSAKAISIAILHRNPDEVLNQKPFVVNVEEISEAAGVSARTVLTYFAAMEAAGSLKSLNETKMNRGGKLTTVKTVTFIG